MMDEDPSGYPKDRLFSRLDQMIELLSKPKVDFEQQLWTIKDIAAWMQLSPFTVSRAVITHPTFPDPLQPCKSEEQQKAQSRWLAAEVLKWLKQKDLEKKFSKVGRPRKIISA